MWASLDLLDKLPKPGQTLMMQGDYRALSGRLMATAVKPKCVGRWKPREAKPAKSEVAPQAARAGTQKREQDRPVSAGTAVRRRVSRP